MMAVVGALPQPQEVAETARERSLMHMHQRRQGEGLVRQVCMHHQWHNSNAAWCDQVAAVVMEGAQTCAPSDSSVSCRGGIAGMKQRKKRPATSSSEKFVSFIAFGTFRSCRLVRNLMTFLTIPGSAELEPTIMADTITTCNL